MEWEPGINGGFVQTFVIQYRKEGQDKWDEHFKVDNITANQKRRKATFDNLVANSVYIIRMYSKNIRGNSSVTRQIRIYIPGAHTCHNYSNYKLLSLLTIKFEKSILISNELQYRTGRLTISL